MGKRLFITEKPSVAMEFAKALGISSGRKNGYIEGNNDIITWCVGHLVTMSYPEKYDEELKSWKMETLPFLPQTFKYEVIKDVKDQYNVVASQMKRDDVSAIYYSGDSAREGEYIQRLVRQMVNPKNKEERRVWIDSQTKEEILKGIREAKLLSEYDLLSDSAYMRAAEDYLFGINLSRAFSIKYGKLFNNIVDTPKYEPIAVGRVMTCVLGMVVERERLIKGTKEIPFYGVKANIGAGINAEWKTTETSKYFESPLLYKSGAFKEKRDAEELQAEMSKTNSVVLKEKKVGKEEKSPALLYNLAELQGDCSSSLKISPDETLQAVQNLYEKKMVTYPRTDARVLSSAIAKEIEYNLKGLLSHGNFSDLTNKIIDSGIHNNIINTKYTNDAMVSDHYAIIPTGQGLGEYSSLSDTEMAVYDMICARFLAIFLPAAVYEKVSCIYDCNGEEFHTSAKELKVLGYLEAYDKSLEPNDEYEKLMAQTQGNEYSATFSVSEGKTSPPKRYTSGNMVLAMENAGQLIEDPELRAQIKNSGIGTSATRAETIKKLVKNKYICLNSKTQVLTPGERGEIIYDIIKEVTPSLLRPEMTANWEKGLAQVNDGAIGKDDFFKKLCAYIAREVDSVKNSDYDKIKESLPEEKKSSDTTGGFTKKNVKPKFKENGKDTMPEECPHCKGKLKDLGWGTVCSGCNVKVPKEYFGMPLTEKQQADLLYKGITETIDGFKKKDGSGTYSAKLKAENDWKIKLCFK